MDEQMVRVVIQLKGQLNTPALQQIRQMVEGAGGHLRPVHPGATDPLLARYFTADFPSRAAADQLIDQLISSEVVTAAYAEPSVMPP